MRPAVAAAKPNEQPDGGLLDKRGFSVGVGRGNSATQAFNAARAQRLISPGNPTFNIRATEPWLLK
ncbi:MAG: hypothetical protein ABSA96_21825 [Candidatus Acidiferrales bacterium]